MRKYSILLENAGMKFQRNNQNQRWYSDNDVIALRKLVTLKNNGDMTLKECAEAVLLWLNGNDITHDLPVVSNDTERNDTDITELKELIHKQNEMIAGLSQQLEQHKKYINDRLEERDQSLMSAMTERLETQKQIAASEEKEEKKSFFSRLFNRG